MQTIMVLGSSGQVGSHLVRYFNAKKYNVIEFDIVNSPEEDLRLAPSREFESLIKQSDFIFFLAFDAGGSHYLETYQDTFDFIDNNLKILIYTINTLKKFDKPFLFASSQMSSMSQSTYGMLKAIGEKFTHSANGKIVKFWNVYGYEKNEKKFHVISDFIKMAKESGEIRMRTNGHETRDFLYADDCCAGLEAIMLNFNNFSKEQQLHLANFEWNSILEVAEIVAQHFNAIIIPGDSLDNVQQGIKNEPDRYLLDFWQPTTALRDGIKKIVQIEDNSL
jgi:nucleoside-diphosphate-sugar epimerase